MNTRKALVVFLMLLVMLQTTTGTAFADNKIAICVTQSDGSKETEYKRPGKANRLIKQGVATMGACEGDADQNGQDNSQSTSNEKKKFKVCQAGVTIKGLTKIQQEAYIENGATAGRCTAQQIVDNAPGPLNEMPDIPTDLLVTDQNSPLYGLAGVNKLKCGVNVWNGPDPYYNVNIKDGVNEWTSPTGWLDENDNDDVYLPNAESFGQNLEVKVTIYFPRRDKYLVISLQMFNDCYKGIVPPGGEIVPNRKVVIHQSQNICPPVEQIAATEFHNGRSVVVNYDVNRETWKAESPKFATLNQSGDSFQPSNDPSSNCKQVYVNRRPDGRLTLWQEDFWGSYHHQMLHENGKPVLGKMPNWGPERIVYVTTNGFLHTINQNGSDDRSLFVRGLMPDYSEDGSKIAFIYEGVLRFINSDGSDLQITDVRMVAPKWLSNQSEICGQANQGVVCYDLESKVTTLVEWGEKFATDPTDADNALFTSKYSDSLFFNLDIEDKEIEIVSANATDTEVRSTLDWTAPDRENYLAIDLRIKRETLGHVFTGDLNADSILAQAEIARYARKPSIVNVVSINKVEDQPAPPMFLNQLDTTGERFFFGSLVIALIYLIGQEINQRNWLKGRKTNKQ